MSRFNTQTSHPIIPNSQEYMFEQQYISIHSEDRNILKYPNSSEFEIELPQDYLNVQGFRLVSGSFPANMDMFSPKKKNVTMTFQITAPYNPTEISPPDAIQTAIYAMLRDRKDNFVVLIETGTYSPKQMETEIANKMNAAVSAYLLGPDTTFTPQEASDFRASGEYTEFVVAYNEVNRKLWIGNRSSEFKLTNTDTARYEEQAYLCLCDNNDISPDFKHWGLPGYLGFTRCDATSTKQSSETQTRFYYGDVKPGDNGVWLTANASLPGATAYFVTAPTQVNLRAPAYFYMEIKLLNSIDETAPFNYSKFTQETNQTNGIVKSAFAKIPLMSTDTENNYYEELNVANYFKIYNPPVERIRKLSIKLRYHDGMLVDFGNNDYTFALELSIFRPQNNRTYSMRVPEAISNNF